MDNRLTAGARGARLSRRPRSCDGSRSSRTSQRDRALVDRPVQTFRWWRDTKTLTAWPGRLYEQIGPVHISEVRTVRLALCAIFFVGLAGCMSLGKKSNGAAAAAPTSLARPADGRDASGGAE